MICVKQNTNGPCVVLVQLLFVVDKLISKTLSQSLLSWFLVFFLLSCFLHEILNLTKRLSHPIVKWVDTQRKRMYQSRKAFCETLLFVVDKLISKTLSQQILKSEYSVRIPRNCTCWSSRNCE